MHLEVGLRSGDLATPFRARLVGTDIAMIVSAADEVLCDPDIHRSMVGAVDLYGDGEGARRCLGALDRLLSA